MAQGKFSQPRPHRDEERQIEQAFRQVTGKESSSRHSSPLYSEDAQIEQAIRETKQQAAPKTQPRSPMTQKPETYDLLPDDLEAFFDENTPVPEEEPYETEPDFVDKMMAFFSKAVDYCKKNQKLVMVGACAGALVLIIVFIAMFFAGASDPNDGKILNNVLIADIDVGGMTKKEAISTVTQATKNTFVAQDMVIDLSGTELRLSPKDTKAKLDVKAAVNAAYDYGRTGTKSEQEQALTLSRTEPHIIGVLPYLELDTSYIKDTLASYAKDSGSTLTQTSYGLEGEEPELSADKFNKNAPTQTLVITMGTPGIGFDVNDVYNQVLDAYSLHVFLVEVENVEAVKEPDPIDLEAIYEEFYIEPVNATVNLQNFKTEPGSYGYGFDLEAAQKLLDTAEYGEEIRIPMEYIEPDVLDSNSFFQDTLGEYQTRATGSSSRTTNLQVACEALDGTELNPGETLSFSDAIGRLTSGNGYREAPEDTGKDAAMGGGVNQVSTTLYCAALLADLDIVSRSNHDYVPSFADYGLDATTSLKIRNSFSYPIRIDAEVSGSHVKIAIIGTEEREHYVTLDYTISSSTAPKIEYEDYEFDNADGYKDGDVIEEGATGYTVKSYKIKHDNKTGQEISRDFVANSQYPVVNKVVARVEPEETTVPTTEATEPSTEPTTAPTTAPTDPPATEPSDESTTATTEQPSQDETEDGDMQNEGGNNSGESLTE